MCGPFLLRADSARQADNALVVRPSTGPKSHMPVLAFAIHHFWANACVFLRA